jgi:cation diffusion facilitator family transporter
MDEQQEKRSAAGNSVWAAVFLTIMKLIVGVLTGSLGILAEAAHSGLDLVAAIVTFIAVRISDRPADIEHTYGHGKIENFSALIETGLLLITCIWIVTESIQRLFFHDVEVDANIWAFLIMLISIIVDVNRSKMLYRVAHKYNSQALEADALHFSTDIWSSSVVLGGLALVWMGKNIFPAYADTLMKADALAALGVAVIVIFVSYQLGKRTIDILLDRAPEGLPQKIAEASQQVEGVLRAGQVRVRRSGPRIFVDMNIDVARNLSFERTHTIADAVETQVRHIVPGAEVLVHTNPSEDKQESSIERIRAVVNKNQLVAHNIVVQETNCKLYVDLHLEVDNRLSLLSAHELANTVEQELRSEMPNISCINTHMESRGTGIVNVTDVTLENGELVHKIKEETDCIIGKNTCHDVMIHQQGESFAVSLHCTLDDELSIAQAHNITTRIENHLADKIPGLIRVSVHAEPRTR